MYKKIPEMVEIIPKEDIFGFCSKRKILLFKKGEPILVNTSRDDKTWKYFRRGILKRDKFTCRECNIKKKEGIILQIHHKIPIYKKPELIYDPDNCKSLCLECHKKTESFAIGRQKTNKPLLKKEKKNIKLIYLDLYKELKKDFPDKVAQVYLSSRIKSHLMKYGMYNKCNIAYLTGFFRNNKILILDLETGYLKWK